MKPNIIFFLIDGLRADQCYGKNRTCVTPNIDLMINHGTFFSQSVSSADGTILSLNSVLTGLFPFRTGTRSIKFSFKKNNFIQQLIDFDYKIYGFGPSLTSFAPLSKYFENKNSGYSAGPPAEPLSANLGKKILKLLETGQMKKPWFCFLHIEELHSLREGSTPVGLNNFDNLKFGNSCYERVVSHIDYWLGRFLEKIDLNSTLVILTSDHGERIPFGNIRGIDLEPKFKTSKKIGLKVLPKSTHNTGGKFLAQLRKPFGVLRLKNANRNLTSYQIRSRDKYFTPSLFDELLRTPLIFYGYKIPKKLITQQVRGVDIFPTIFDILDLKSKNRTDGQSLHPLVLDKQIPELPNFIHTIPHQKYTKLDCLGIRTSKFKFFRSIDPQNSNVYLYDLTKDPYENLNIARQNTKKLTEMNLILENFLNKTENSIDETNDSKMNEQITKELQRLGYH